MKPSVAWSPPSIKWDIGNAILDELAQPCGFIERCISSLRSETALEFLDPFQAAMIELFPVWPIPQGSVGMLTHSMQERSSARGEYRKSLSLGNFGIHALTTWGVIRHID